MEWTDPEVVQKYECLREGREEEEGARWRGDGGRTGGDGRREMERRWREDGGDGRRGRQESEGEICKEQNMYTEM